VPRRIAHASRKARVRLDAQRHHDDLSSAIRCSSSSSTAASVPTNKRVPPSGVKTIDRSEIASDRIAIYGLAAINVAIDRYCVTRFAVDAVLDCGMRAKL
jgi:hypothetical protein